jgi:CubicO group peptidase (beta-lactamase class C family)
MNEERPDGAIGAGIRQLLEAGIASEHFSGAACAVSVDGDTAVELYLGTQATWGPDGRRIPEGQRTPVDASTLFDLASVTKIFTAHTALALVDAGVADLDVPIAEVLSSYGSGDRARVTLRHLLTHTSGLPATWLGWHEQLNRYLAGRPETERLTATPLQDREALIADLLRTPLEDAPGSRFEYACTGYNTTMALFEALTGRDWPSLVSENTLDPLGLRDVTGDPELARAAATEYQPHLHRGVVKGVVHDESAWSLGGNAGNAGLFATARDLLAFGEAIRIGEGRVRGEWMWDDALTAALGRPTTSADGGFGAALGLRIGDRSFMGASSGARGHTGFTGTSLHIDRDAGFTIALLTNRVHPSREGNGLQELRARIADSVSAAVARV